MMTVEELFTKLSVGELSNLSMSNEGSGQIQEKSQAKLISYTNDALMQLYSRFVLLEKFVVIEMIQGITSYYLMKRFAQSNCALVSQDPCYIKDLLEPFEEDVIKILEVQDHLGRRVTLNDQSDALSMFTPRPNMLQVPRPVEGLALSISYQARHRKLEPGVMEAPIYLPEVLEEALLAFVAGKVYSHMNGEENSAKGQEYKGKYEEQCQLVVDRDLVNNTPDTTSEIFKRNGWI